MKGGSLEVTISCFSYWLWIIAPPSPPPPPQNNVANSEQHTFPCLFQHWLGEGGHGTLVGFWQLSLVSGVWEVLRPILTFAPQLLLPLTVTSRHCPTKGLTKIFQRSKVKLIYWFNIKQTRADRVQPESGQSNCAMLHTLREPKDDRTFELSPLLLFRIWKIFFGKLCERLINSVSHF